MTRQLYYEDVAVGQEIPELVKEITIPIMMRWCAAVEIWRRDHWDRDYARNQRKLPDALLSSGFKQAAVYQMLRDWVGEGGWVYKMTHQDRGPVYAGEALTGSARVTKKYVKNGHGYVELEGGFRRKDGTVAVPTTAVIVLPLKGGRAVPYPFRP